jgi:EAL domain-containing protein (putative c-di-GMP-specific phosphodiesterase class I)
MRTVAEHVTNAATLETLRKYGIDYAQGYYIGKPSSELPTVRTTESARRAR